MNKLARYNPNSETGDLRQAAAANWELLRRSTKFEAVVDQWITNAAFRLDHLWGRKTYFANTQARCALDWMLTANQRYALARFQLQNYLFFWDPRANYGPIIVKRHLESRHR